MLSRKEGRRIPLTLRTLMSMAAVAFVLSPGAVNAWTQPLLHIQSPDGHISATVRIREGHVFWEALLDGRAVLDSAPLGIGVVGEQVAPVARFGTTRQYA